jgi:2-polyprenyl-3-methyl-5-hydroxy-6-metoxy-1,4-benzoquinol methylase
MSWEDDQEFERTWWGECSNTFTEEIKQLSYAYKMGLTAYANAGKWPCYNLVGRSVLDIGGGPTSMLLKCENKGLASRVEDPCDYPDWIKARYASVGIGYGRTRGEELQYPQYTSGIWDEVWIYNVLQHVEDPELIITNARKVAPVIRIFEWIDLPHHEGHPQELKEENLNKWLGGIGTTEWLDENNCYGRAYYGVFNY